uniref:Transmembrane protein n=1 Tax=Nelumbo nucifera TaxID=4432 RepID=A0A822YGF3_NELNU|nr:TPA_asm: hypothetical protein HUJ06_031514 [Nelumbo nucifera]
MDGQLSSLIGFFNSTNFVNQSQPQYISPCSQYLLRFYSSPLFFLQNILVIYFIFSNFLVHVARFAPAPTPATDCGGNDMWWKNGSEPKKKRLKE